MLLLFLNSRPRPMAKMKSRHRKWRRESLALSAGKIKARDISCNIGEQSRAIGVKIMLRPRRRAISVALLLIILNNAAVRDAHFGRSMAAVALSLDTVNLQRALLPVNHGWRHRYALVIVALLFFSRAHRIIGRPRVPRWPGADIRINTLSMSLSWRHRPYARGASWLTPLLINSLANKWARKGVGISASH